jgi:hypothetical protein
MQVKKLDSERIGGGLWRMDFGKQNDRRIEMTLRAIVPTCKLRNERT